MLLLLFVLSFLLSQNSFSGAPAHYYSTAIGHSGNSLRSRIHSIIKNHTVIPYTSSGFDVRAALPITDQSPGSSSNLILIYSRVSLDKSLYNTTNGWNREHLWPNSYGLLDTYPAFSDLHNLRPAYGRVNSARGNKYYDSANPLEPSYLVPAHELAPLTKRDFDSWEPPDSVKGDIARALFYMDIRYESDPTNNEPDLALTDDINLIQSNSYYMGKLSTLLQWNKSDPVDSEEVNRNERVYSIQNNRNPFIDHPEWVDYVFGPYKNLPKLNIELVNNKIKLFWSEEFSLFAVKKASKIEDPYQTLNSQPVIENGFLKIEEVPLDSSFYILSH